MDNKYDMAVVGAGPAGYVAAIRAAQMSQKVVLIEKEKVGGTCMNWGCIPTKFLLHQTHIWEEWKQNRNIEGPKKDMVLNWEKVQQDKSRRVDRLVRGIEFLLKQNGVTVRPGTAELKGKGALSVRNSDGDAELRADHIILATGSKPTVLPFLRPNGREIVTSREALDWISPPRKLLILGAGAIGLEMGTIFHRLGSEVEILELLPQIIPGSDPELAKRLERCLKKQGIKIHTQVQMTECEIKDGRVILKGISLKDQKSVEVIGDKVLSAVGRSPLSEGLSGPNHELEIDKFGSIPVNSKFETAVSGIYAVGDLIGGMLLAHKASHEGIMAVENALGAQHSRDSLLVPAAVFTDPEFASVGLTENEAERKFGSVGVGRFSLQANGRALTLGKSDGMVKLITDSEETVVGAHILSPYASEIIPEMTLAVGKNMKISEIDDVIHIHPTLSESMGEALWSAGNRAIHVMNE